LFEFHYLGAKSIGFSMMYPILVFGEFSLLPIIPQKKFSPKSSGILIKILSFFYQKKTPIPKKILPGDPGNLQKIFFKKL